MATASAHTGGWGHRSAGGQVLPLAADYRRVNMPSAMRLLFEWEETVRSATETEWHQRLAQTVDRRCCYSSSRRSTSLEQHLDCCPTATTTAQAQQDSVACASVSAACASNKDVSATGGVLPQLHRPTRQPQLDAPSTCINRYAAFHGTGPYSPHFVR